MRKFVSAVGVAVILSAGCAGRRVTTFTEMEKRVPAGTTLYVATDDGKEIKGKLAAISGQTLRLTLRDAATREFREMDVTRVRARDPLWNGALIGAAAAGISAAALVETGCVAPYAAPDCKTVSRGAGVAIMAGLGGGVGLLFDVLHHRRVFRGAKRARGASLFIAPVLAPNTAGVRVSSRF